MPQKYYNMAEAAAALGVSEEDVAKMRDNRELHGYRDGANWKFKSADIERIAGERKSSKETPPTPTDQTPDEEGDVLLSEVELGGSEAGASGTVIGMAPPEQASPGSDVQTGGSDLQLSGDQSGGKGDEPGSKASQFEDLDLTLDEDLSLDDSQIGSGDKESQDSESGGSDVKLDDDDLVIGGSGSGSDITLGGDSGISLVDPSDSGLSLEEPLDLGAGEESLELGEDDMVVLDDEGSDAQAGAGDDDFLLTPVDEDEDADSESGSQVIALDHEGDESATMVASTSSASMAAMLDEDFSGQAGPGFEAIGGDAALGSAPGGLAEGAPLGESAGLPEAPWPVWSVVGLGLCATVLVFCGIFMVDLTRNMWSWEGTYDINSSLMDMILNMF